MTSNDKKNKKDQKMAVKEVKEQIQVLFNKKMDRQDFIKHVAVGVVAMTGAGAALRTLAPKQQKAVGSAYGASAYGGASDLRKTA